MFTPMFTKTTEIVLIPPSDLVCLRSSILTSLRQMYIDLSCSRLGISLNVKDMKTRSIVVNPENALDLSQLKKCPSIAFLSFANLIDSDLVFVEADFSKTQS